MRGAQRELADGCVLSVGRVTATAVKLWQPESAIYAVMCDGYTGRYLSLNNNRLSGTIPSTISRLTSLTLVLDIALAVYLMSVPVHARLSRCQST